MAMAIDTDQNARDKTVRNLRRVRKEFFTFSVLIHNKVEEATEQLPDGTTRTIRFVRYENIVKASEQARAMRDQPWAHRAGKE